MSGKAKLATVAAATLASTVVPTFSGPASVQAATRQQHRPWYETHNGPRAYARRQTNRRQYRCLRWLWRRESGWHVHARNPSSGAYGIPQADPGYKMRTAGPDWRNNGHTQVRWGLRYIRHQYGTPCHAWHHSQRTGWY